MFGPVGGGGGGSSYLVALIWVYVFVREYFMVMCGYVLVGSRCRYDGYGMWPVLWLEWWVYGCVCVCVCWMGVFIGWLGICVCILDGL